MHPTCRRVPPRKGSFSTTIVFSPSSPARIAATYPPGPLPIIATSYFATRSLPSAGARTGDQTWCSDCHHTSVTLEETRGGRAKKAVRQSFVLRTPFQTYKKPPAFTAQTAASQQTRNFNSRTPPSQPPPREPTSAGSVRCTRGNIRRIGREQSALLSGQHPEEGVLSTGSSLPRLPACIGAGGPLPGSPRGLRHARKNLTPSRGSAR